MTRLATVAGRAWGRRPRKPRLGAHANRRWLLADRLSFATSLHPHIASRRAPLQVTVDARISDGVKASAGASISVCM
jgi:hypothetical protein